MPWTYDPNHTSDRDKVRALVGDTEETKFSVDDATVAMHLTGANNNVYIAASNVALNMGAKYGREADRSIGPISISYRSQAESAIRLSEALRDHASNSGSSGTGMKPFAGGLDRAPIARIGMHDVPGTEAGIYGEQ